MRFSEYLLHEQLARILEDERQERGLSISGLARKLEMDERYVYRLLNGTTDLRLSTLARLLDKLGYEIKFVKRR